MSDEEQKGPGESRACAHGPDELARASAPPSPPAPPPGETETQTELVEIETSATAEPTAGEAMVGLLARRAALPQKVIDAIERGLGAKRWSWDPGTKSRVYDDDHNVQLKAATLYLEYVVGRPVERELVVTNGKGEGFAIDDLMGSPALRRALARRIEAAERVAFGKGE